MKKSIHKTDQNLNAGIPKLTKIKRKNMKKKHEEKSIKLKGDQDSECTEFTTKIKQADMSKI